MVQARGKRGNSTEAQGATVLAILGGIIELEMLPGLLWWVGLVRPRALWIIEGLGCELADQMDHGGDGFDGALARMADAVECALEKQHESGEALGPRPIWAFWSLFTRGDEPESPLSALLREAIGYPTDEEAGMPFLATTLETDASRGRR